MRARRLRKPTAHLEITAFINLIVVLVPFLLSTAVFTRLAVIDLSLPAQSSGAAALHVDNLQLEVVIRADALEVGDRIGGLIQRIAAKPAGHDLDSLARLVRDLKARFPQKSQASVLAEPNTPYETLVRVMDVLRSSHAGQGAKVVTTELFPDISIGDAPRRIVAMGKP
jgi:biopolymer transport protein ExbD